MQVPTLVHPQKCAILSSRGGANGGQPSCGRGMKTFGEVISELRKERSNPEGVSCADQEKRWHRDRDRLHQRHRARPQKPAVARFRGAVGGGVGSTTRGSAVLRRTAPFGQENRRSFP
jgi:hypothetical protein